MNNWYESYGITRPFYSDDAVCIVHGDCMEILPSLPKVDLVLTSPPYDDLRDYGGHGFDYEAIIDSIVPVLGLGAVCVWVVGDSVIDGGETGNSLRHALKFIDNGLRLHDTMIYEKNGAAYPASAKSNRYSQVFEYMFILSNGKPKTVNLIKDKANKWAGTSSFGVTTNRQANGVLMSGGKRIVGEYGYRDNIWRINNGKGFGGDDMSYQHPASFPEQLAGDHIMTWTNPSDIVLDPMCGSGTTLKMAIKTGRKCIGIEIEEKYCHIAATRCSQAVMNLNV